MRKRWRIIGLVLLTLLIVIQFIRPPRTNPPIDPAKELHASPEVAAILDRSCKDCHSSKTVWPWYSNVAPMSWLLYDDVKSGREAWSASEWRTYSVRKQGNRLEKICEEVKKGDMPLWFYLPLHPKAKVSPEDVKVLCFWSAAAKPPL